MKTFALLFRMDITTKEAQPTPSQMEGYMKMWEAWISEIASENKLAEGGNHFSYQGKVIHSNKTITDNPYTENKQSIAGYINIRTKTTNEALAIAKKCPILEGENTSVEIREIETQ